MVAHKYVYEVRKYKALKSGAFEATIFKDGRSAVIAENDGRGGCNRYMGGAGMEGAVYRQAIEDFKKVAEKWGKDIGDNGFEIEDAFVDALVRNYETEKKDLLIFEEEGDFVSYQIPRKGASDKQLKDAIARQMPGKKLRFWDVKTMSYKA